jgi:hypothetical protein
MSNFDLVAKQTIELATRELARRRLLDFVLFTKHDFQVAAHHKLIASALDRVISGECKRLIISMPPRHGKSELASIRFPAFYLGRNPDKQVIHISYAASLSNDFSRQVRALVSDSDSFQRLFPDFALSKDRARIDDWKSTKDGGFKSIGVQGGVTGHGADLMIIDDPMKEGDEQSLVTMNAIYDWFASAAQTRLMPGAAVVLILARWSPLDLAGRLLDLAKADPKADQWEELVLPALANEHDALGRKPGEALWPEWYPVQRLYTIRASSERYFEALFQQQPRSGDSQMFFESGFIMWDARMNLAGAAWCFDLAISEDSASDYTAFARWQYDRSWGNLFVSNIRRYRRRWPVTKKLIKRILRAFPDDVVVFPKQTFELMAVQELRHECPNDSGRILFVDKMPGDKTERAQALADRCESGRVFVQRGRFARQFVSEHVEFPGLHDDLVDMSSVATHYFHISQEFSWLIKEPVREAVV